MPELETNDTQRSLREGVEKIEQQLLVKFPTQRTGTAS